MKNLYRVTLRHTHADGHTMDYDVKVEADSKQQAIRQCYGPKRQVVGIEEAFRLNHVQIVALIIASVGAAIIGIVYWLTRY
jgi:hypothetical protein